MAFTSSPSIPSALIIQPISDDSLRGKRSEDDSQTLTLQTETGELITVTLPQGVDLENQTLFVQSDEAGSIATTEPQVKGDVVSLVLPSTSTERHRIINTEFNESSTEAIGEDTRQSYTDGNNSNMSDLIGKYEIYFCKKCNYRSTKYEDVCEHVKIATCSQDKSKLGLNGSQFQQSSKDSEHSYAAQMIDDQSCNLALSDTGIISSGKSLETSLISNSVPMNNTSSACLEKVDNRFDIQCQSLYEKYSCAKCPHTRIYSNIEFLHHRLCHEASNTEDLFSCHICLSSAEAGRKQRGRVIATSADWIKYKTHLSKVHQVDFLLTCGWCQMKFKSHVTFQLHVMTHWYKCYIEDCDYQSEKHADMEIHINCHVNVGNGDQFKCYLCDYQHLLFPKLWSKMYDHLVQVHMLNVATQYTCQKCGLGFHHSQSFDQHYKECVQVKLVCEYCGHLVPGKLMKDHVDRLHATGDDNQETENTVSEDDSHEISTKHQTTVKDEDVEFLPSLGSSLDPDNTPVTVMENKVNMICTRHKLEFASEAEMRDHFENEHNRSSAKRKQYSDYITDFKTPSTSTDIIKCEGVDKADRENLINQINDLVNEESDNSYKPNIMVTISNDKCEKQRPVKKKRGRPTQETDPDKQVRCKLCYKIFANEQRLEEHCRRVHTEEKMQKLPCSACGKLFRDKVQRRNHFRQVHEGIKCKPSGQKNPKDVYLMCKYCGYVTPEKSRLKNHQLAVHAGLMPYQCDLCDFKTCEPSDFRRHKIRHTGVKKHKCEYCSYASTERWVLVNHCSKLHGVQLPKLHRDTMGCALSLKWQKKRQNMGEEIKTEEYITVIQDSDKNDNQSENCADQLGSTAESGTVPINTENILSQVVASNRTETVSMDGTGFESIEKVDVIYAEQITGETTYLVLDTK